MDTYKLTTDVDFWRISARKFKERKVSKGHISTTADARKKVLEVTEEK